MSDELKRTELVKSLTLLLTIIALIVGATVFVADRPSRTEVKEIINTTVSARLTRIENQLTNINDYLLEHGVSNNQGARE